MNINYYEQEDGIKKLTQLLWEGKLVPFFGAGFSKGCSVRNSHKIHIPDGTQTTVLMNEMLIKLGFDDSILNDNFNETAKLFLSQVPRIEIKDFFREYFTGATINDIRKNFLDLPWGYAYTLNVDDAIERTGLFTPIYPYKRARINNIPDKALYKLHGDASQEANYDLDDDNIVFSSAQYVNSLTSRDNTTFINAVSNDYKQNNLLFIGCSLISEPDLEVIYSNAKPDVSDNTMRIVLRSEKLNKKDELRLASEYGINTVIIVSNYELFYMDFVSEYERIHAKVPFSYQNPRIIRNLSKNNSIEYFAGRNIFDNTQNAFLRPNLFILRDCIKRIENELLKSSCVVLKGRRLSGKTFVMSSLIERYAGYTVFYFPSNTAEDENSLFELFMSNKNSIFLFDSNSLTSNAYHFVSNSIEKIKENDNKVVLAVNSSDSYFSELLNAEIITISPYFNKKEITNFSPISNDYGFSNRKSSQTNIDYLELLRNRHKINVPLIDSAPIEFTKNERIMLFVLCARDKMFYSEITALDILFGNVNSFVQRMNGIVESVPTTLSEKGRRSTHKLVFNSKYVILSIVKKFPRKMVLEVIEHIAFRLTKDRVNKRLYIDCCLFDTLNQIFGDAGDLIFNIYEMLANYVSDDMDYWLQRAKSIYRLKTNNSDELTTAYSYAQKAFADGDERVRAKAALTLSLICCLLSRANEVDASNVDEYEKEAIDKCYYAVKSNFTNKHVSDEFQKDDRRGYSKIIIEICDKYYRLSDRDLREKAITIKNILI